MIYFPETINTVSTRTLNTITLTRSLVLSQLCAPLTLCMLASWSHEGAVFLDFLSSSHPITSSLFPYLGSTDAPCSRLGVPVPPSPKWRPHSQGPRTLPYRDPEQLDLVYLQCGPRRFNGFYSSFFCRMIQQCALKLTGKTVITFSSKIAISRTTCRFQAIAWNLFLGPWIVYILYA